MSRPRVVVAVALAVAVGSALPLQGGDESARAEVGSATGPLVATDGNGACSWPKDCGRATAAPAR
jgi:hypothetical protein